MEQGSYSFQRSEEVFVLVTRTGEENHVRFIRVTDHTSFVYFIVASCCFTVTSSGFLRRL